VAIIAMADALGLEHAAQRAQRSRTNGAILFVDIDRFKAVNDTHGHQVGDQLLLAIARRLSRLVRPGDTLARVSGDEFVFLCEDLANAEDLLAGRIDEAFGRSLRLLSVDLDITASVGVAFAGPGWTSTTALSPRRTQPGTRQIERAAPGIRSSTYAKPSRPATGTASNTTCGTPSSPANSTSPTSRSAQRRWTGHRRRGTGEVDAPPPGAPYLRFC
jgi:diguanylate cyclase (GGDEF)-like protein